MKTLIVLLLVMASIPASAQLTLIDASGNAVQTWSSSTTATANTFGPISISTAGGPAISPILNIIAASNVSNYVMKISSADGTQMYGLTDSGRLVVGPQAPAVALEVNGTAAVISMMQAPVTATSSPVLRFLAADTTVASPSVPAAGDRLGVIRFDPYTGAAYALGASKIDVFADEVPSTTNQGTTMKFSTTILGGVSRTTPFIISGSTVTVAAGALRYNMASTGAGTASLSTNSPAGTPTAPYEWWTVMCSDGTTCYIPVWK